MALRGNLKDFSLPDVFQLVTFSKKTGVLRIKRADGADGSVWFRDGEVFFAQSNWHGEPLGERLVHANKITPSALAKALAARKQEPEGGRRLGEILVEEGYITDKVLEGFVQEQIQDTIFDLMRWDEGDFDFELLPDVVDEDIGLSVSIENVIMEGSRRLEEWTRIKKKIPSMEIVFKMATAPGEGTFEISLKPIEWNLLLLVDGTRSVADLARQTNRTDFEVARIMYGLFSAGLLEVAGDEEVERLRAERAEQDKVVEAIRARQAEEEAAAARESVERESALAEEAKARLESEQAAQSAPSASAAVEAAEETGRQTPVPAEEADRVPEVPEFLAGGAAEAQATPEDMAVFEAMMGAVLEAPAEPPAAAAAPEVEPEPEPEPVVAPAPEPEPEVAPAPEPEPTGDLERDLMALGLGELPTADLLEPMHEEPEPDFIVPDIPPAPVAELLEAVAEIAPEHAEEPESGAEEPSEAWLGQLGEAAELTIEPVQELEPEPSTEYAADLSDILQSLDEEAEQTAAEIVETVSFDAEEPSSAGGGVISTDAFLADIGGEELGVGLSGGLGDELSALTGAGGSRRPTASVNRIPERGSSSGPRMDQTVDKELVLKIIEGIKNL